MGIIRVIEKDPRVFTDSEPSRVPPPTVRIRGGRAR